MLSLEGIVTGLKKRVPYTKKQIGDSHYLYSFRDTSRARIDENTFLDRAVEHGYDADRYEAKAPYFGKIVFESDQDLTPEEDWHCYGSLCWYLTGTRTTNSSD